MKLSTELADYDVAGTHEFTAELLYAPALAGAVAAISRTAARFFMSHDIFLRALSDILHTHSGEGLPVTLPFPVIFAPLMLEDHDFAKAPLLDYGGLNFDAFHNRPANL
jgi:hypothetical protein